MKKDILKKYIPDYKEWHRFEMAWMRKGKRIISGMEPDSMELMEYMDIWHTAGIEIWGAVRDRDTLGKLLLKGK